MRDNHGLEILKSVTHLIVNKWIWIYILNKKIVFIKYFYQSFY
jgi:hypothetical protein